MKKRIVVLLTALLLIFTHNVGLADKNDVDVFVKGQFILEENILTRGRTFVPVRVVSEVLDFDVEYVAKDRNIILKKNDREIRLSIGSSKVYVDGKEKLLDSPPFIKNGKSFVPLRFISEALDENVIWDDKNKTVIVGEYGQDTNKKDTYVYYNESEKYTLNLPNNWKDNVVLEEKNDRLNIYDRKSMESFREDGDTCGPTLEIRVSDKPSIPSMPYDGDILVSFSHGKYIEARFDRDFQYYKETKESYDRVQKEAREVLKSFKIIEDENTFIEDDINNLQKENKILESIVNKYLPKNIFKLEETEAYSYPMNDDSFLYLRNLDSEGNVIIKIESNFNNDGNLIRYHFKNYTYNFKNEQLNKISQKEALDLANKFAAEYVGEDVNLIKIPDLYPSLYEEGKHESYGDLGEKYILVVDLEKGFVEFFTERD